MNNYNGVLEPNYIAVWKTTREGWYYSRSYECYINENDYLRDDIAKDNVCP